MSFLLRRRVLRLYCLLHEPLLRGLSSTATTVGCPPQPPSSSSFAVQFLTTSCGLTPARALSAALTVRIDEKTRQQPESVLALLKSHGFSDTQIAEIVSRWPRVLVSRVEKKLGPKLQFLTRAGVPLSLIAREPGILWRSLDGRIRPSIDFVRRFLSSAEDVRAMFRRNRWCLNYDLPSTMIPNVELLLELGVSVPAISKLMVEYSRNLMKKHERFAEIVQMVQDWGLKPEKNLFLHALRVMCSMTESTLAARLELFRTLGWSEEEVITAFRRSPSYIVTSERKITCISSFARKLGLEPSDLSRNPKLLTCSFDKRILPRYAVWRVLTSKGLIKHSTGQLVLMLTIAEKPFLGRYVMRYTDKVPELMDVYCRKTKFELEGFGLGDEESRSN
uniref:Proline--tRNA ligase n=1 Tax=Anthurium amnicola TaxID=1678845 RepID=A0A1D1Y279_9ARAE